jgi:DNA-binding IclR family transcriptional regulator
MQSDTHAFLVSVGGDVDRREFVVFARLLLDAARHVDRELRTRGMDPADVTLIRRLAPALMAAGSADALAAGEPPPAPLGMRGAEEPKSARGRARAGGAAAGPSPGAAVDSVTEPESRRTAAAEASSVGSAPPPRRPAGMPKAVPELPLIGTRAQQLLAAVKVLGGEAHASEIAAALCTNVLNARNVIAVAVSKGLVRRVGVRSGRVALVDGDATVPAPPAPANRSQPTRSQQLVSLLQERDRPLLFAEVIAAFDITRAHANRIVETAAKAGLVVRGPRGAGLVALPDQDLEPLLAEQGRPTAGFEPFTTAPGTSRGDQLLLLLRERGPQMHVRSIAGSLGITRQRTNTLVVQAVAAGQVERLGRRTGQVRVLRSASRAGAASVELGVEEAGNPHSPVPGPPLEGLPARVLEALTSFAEPVTAKEVASVVGGRPREAGNALVQLVERGIVDRQKVEGRPARYRVREGASAVSPITV